MLPIVVAAAMAAQPVSYVRNGRCETLAGWELPQGTAKLATRDGGKCILITAGAASQRIWRRPGWKRMTVAVDMRVEEVIEDQPGGFAYAAVYQYDAGEALVTFHDFVHLRQPADWKRYSYTFDVAPETATMTLYFGFYRAHGRAYFDNWTLVEGSNPQGIDQVREAFSRHGSHKVVIWRQPGLALPPGGMSPTWAASVLRSAGFSVSLVDRAKLGQALADAAGGLAIFPYGPAYPVEQKPSIIEFCRGAGKLLIVGGYPFNRPLGPRGEDWVAELRRKKLQAEKWPSNLLPDGGFEGAADAPVGGQDLTGRWRRSSAGACKIVEGDVVEGRKCAHVRGTGGEVMWYTYVPAGRGHDYLLRASVRTRDIRGPGFAYVAVYQYAGNKIIDARDVVHLRGDNDWQQVEYRFTSKYGADRLFIKTGVYRAGGEAWFDKVQLVDLTAYRWRPLNTSSAPPGDGLKTAAWQMGMCDAGFPLQRVAFLRAAADQTLIQREEAAAAHGWACVGVVGYSSARWVPLLDAVDRYGRLRGAAGALMLNYGGFYRGSLWAYFGVTDRSLFGRQVPGSDEELVELVRFLLRGVFLHSLKTDFDLYQPGETCRVRFSVGNFGPEEFHGTARVILVGRRDYDAAELKVDVPAGQSSAFEAELTVPRCEEDILEVVASLEDGQRRIDRTRSGIVVRQRKVVREAPQLKFADNYFRLGGRPIFLFGSDNYRNDYLSDALNPRRWDEIQAKARDFGVQVYENLQYNNPGHAMKEKDWRAFEAMGQLLQKRGLVFMCGLLIGHNVAVDDEELSAEDRLCEEYARRLGFLPALLWYINGDYQLRYEDKKWLRQAWNRWLNERYGSGEALRTAWRRDSLPPLGELDFPPKRTGAWDDPVEQDRVRFNAWLMRRWNRAHVEAIRRADQAHNITSEYYSEPWNGIDQRLTIDGQDVANFGFFSTPEDDLDVLPERLAINDLRAVGKGVSIGEYGCKTHPAWTVENGARGYHIARSQQQQRQLFMAVAAYALGMGASKIQNWCLRDADENVFPWGIFYPGRNVPKDVAFVHRNLSMMWRLLEPRYEAPETTVLVPTPLRTGSGDVAGRRAVYGAAQALLRLHIRFNVLDDFDIQRLPPQTKTVVWPVAVAESERVFTAVERWVGGGGQLVITGLPRWDENRRPVGDGRLRELVGCRVAEAGFEGVARESGQELKLALGARTVRVVPQARAEVVGGARVVARAADGTPVVVARRLGKGTVVWIADPIELAGREGYGALTALYRAALAELPRPPARIAVWPDDPEVHVMLQPTRTAKVWVVFPTPRQGRRHYNITAATPAGRVTLRVRRRWPAMAVVSDDGRLLMVLADGAAAVGGQQVLGGGAMAGVASLDGRDLRHSSAALAFPFSTGSLRLPTLRGGVELGEWRDGRWHVLEDPGDSGGGVAVKLDTDRATGVVLVCPRSQRARWRRYLEELCQRPWKLRGY